MNWQRLLLFVLLLWLATVVVEFPFGFMQGVHVNRWGVASVWLSIGQVAAVFLTWLAVIAELARRQRDRTWEHAAGLVLLGWLTSLPNTLLSGAPVLAWLLRLPALGVVLLIAVPIGKRLSRR